MAEINQSEKDVSLEARKELNTLLSSFGIDGFESNKSIQILNRLYLLVRNREILKVPELAEGYKVASEGIEAIVILKFSSENLLPLIFELLNICEDMACILEETKTIPRELIHTLAKFREAVATAINTVWQELSKVETLKPELPQNIEEGQAHPNIPAVNVSGILPSHETVKIEEKDLLNDFINSSQEIVSAVEDNLLTLENEPQNDAIINDIFRGIHTLKGDSGFLKFQDIQSLSHTFETLLGRCRNHTIPVDAQNISLFLTTLDVLKRMLKNLSLRLKVFNKEIKDPSYESIDLTIPIQRLQIVLQGGKLSEVKQSEVELEPGSAQKPTEQPKSSDSIITDAIRVPQKKIEDAEEMVGELLIALSLLKQNPEIRVIRQREALEKMGQLELIIEQLQSNILKMKMFPIGSIFNKLSRIVRDLSQKLSKKIIFKTEGIEVEIDKALIDEIYSPLMHIIRNSIDHGIEMPETRKANGKPESGTIILRAENRGDNVNIEIRDDGGGLNRDRILKKAIEKNIVKEGETLSDSQVYNLIFAPGFSTAEKVTEISGRGVGMDVVRTTVEQFGGNLSIDSEPGKGTTIQIKLPLSSSIIEGLVVGVGKSKFIFPVVKIIHTLIPKLSDLNYAFDENGLFIIFEKHTTPIIKLGEYYNIPGCISEPNQASTLIVEFRKQFFGIMVDEILHRQKVVSKSFKDRFKDVPGLKSGTILGDGSVGFIVDPADIITSSLTEKKMKLAG